MHCAPPESRQHISTQGTSIVRKVTLPKTDLCVSRFIFGTASLFNVGRQRDRMNLLSAAVDAGFSHFDTAPYYGFGLAERDMRPMLKAHPDVSFTTKVGIYSPGGERQSGAAVFVRKAGGRLVPALSRPTIDFSIARARRALEGSLQRTGRDRIDLYTLHEPELPMLVAAEWQRWLEDCRSSGKVRHFGLALTADKLAPFLEQDAMIGDVVQLCDSFEEREADLLERFGIPMQITYGYVSSALRHQSPLSVPELLKQSLQRNAEGAVIVSSTKVHRLPQYAAIAEDAAHDQ